MPIVLGLVSFRIYPTLMGGQKGVALFYKYLHHHLPVVLASANNNEEGPVPQERVLFTNRQIYRNVGRLPALVTLAKEKKADIILAEHSYTGWLAWLLHRRTGLPFIIHSHNMEGRRFRKMNRWWWKPYEAYEGWIHRKAHHNFFISREDLQYSIHAFRLAPEKCSVITYGVEEKKARGERATLKRSAGFAPADPLLLFNGTLDYEPNFEAVCAIIDQLVPRLLKAIPGVRVVITGNRVPDWLIQKMAACPQLVYAGYVPDVDVYYQACDLFINPVSNDTGVKTKLIEALANHCTAVSFVSGASGIDREVCGDKLITVPDGDWDIFAGEIARRLPLPWTQTPALFFEQYRWEAITAKAAAIIRQVSQQP